MKMFKKYANLVIASALFVATIPMHGMEAVSIEIAPVIETVEVIETPNVTPVVWYKNINYQQGAFVAACIATLIYVIASRSNDQLAIAKSLQVDPVVVESDAVGFIAPESTEISAATFLKNMTMSFKDFGKKVASIVEQYNFDKCSVDPDMIGADELAEKYGHAVKQAIAQQYGSAQ